MVMTASPRFVTLVHWTENTRLPLAELQSHPPTDLQMQVADNTVAECGFRSADVK